MNSEINTKFTIINEFFREIKETREIVESVDRGVFIKGSMIHIFELFQDLVKQKLITKNDAFLDTGSGDGRICVLASLFGLQSYGIEYNIDIYKHSVDLLNKLDKKGIFHDGNQPKVVCGDFFDNNIYKSLNVKFHDFKIIYNYTTYQNDLAEKIKEVSIAGTIFIFHSPISLPYTFPELNLIHKKHLNGIHQVIYVFRKN